MDRRLEVYCEIVWNLAFSAQFFVVLQGWSQAEALTTIIGLYKHKQFFLLLLIDCARVQQVNQAEKNTCFFSLIETVS